MEDAFYLPDDDGFASTANTTGPWDERSQHAGPPAALLGRALERCEPRDGFRIARVTFEILKPVPVAPVRVEATVARPGRSVELLEATMTADGAPVMTARAWRILTGTDNGPSVGMDEQPPRAPAPDDAQPFDRSGRPGYSSAMEWLYVEGGAFEPGPAKTWMRMKMPLVAGEQPTPLQRVLIAADSGNGVSAVLDFATHLFINTDLQVNLLRDAEGDAVCLDAVTRVHPDGIGITETILWDQRGRIGRATQTLLVRPR